MIKLTRDQIQDVTLQEIEYQLTVMKQYNNEEETKAYLLLLKRYGSLLQRESIMSKYVAAWGDTIDVDAI